MKKFLASFIKEIHICIWFTDYSVDMEMDEYNSNNEAGFGTDLKVKLKNKDKQIT